MNEYATMAWRHWQTWLPKSFAQIEDPEEFFTRLGEEVETEIADLGLQLAGDDPPGETYMGKLSRLNMAQLQAREKVLAERVLLDPEPEVEDQIETETRSQVGGTSEASGSS